MAQYLQKWCPVDDELLVNAEWLDFDKRQQKTFTAAEFFVYKFPHLFQNMDMDIDGAALVHLLPTTSISTFDQYADSVFLPHLRRQLEKCVHLDVVWDVYIIDSIKASTREKRGQGIRRKVAGKNIVPTNWMGFLYDEKKQTRTF